MRPEIPGLVDFGTLRLLGLEASGGCLWGLEAFSEVGALLSWTFRNKHRHSMRGMVGAETSNSMFSILATQS